MSAFAGSPIRICNVSVTGLGYRSTGCLPSRTSTGTVTWQFSPSASVAVSVIVVCPYAFAVTFNCSPVRTVVAGPSGWKDTLYRRDSPSSSVKVSERSREAPPPTRFKQMASGVFSTRGGVLGKRCYSASSCGTIIRVTYLD